MLNRDCRPVQWDKPSTYMYSSLLKEYIVDYRHRQCVYGNAYSSSIDENELEVILVQGAARALTV